MANDPIKSMRAFIKLSQDNIRVFKHEGEFWVFIQGDIIPRKAFEALVIHAASRVQPSRKSYEMLTEYIWKKLHEIGVDNPEELHSNLAYRVKRKLQMPPEKPDSELYAFAQGKPAMYYLICYEQLLEEQNDIQST